MNIPLAQMGALRGLMETAEAAKRAGKTAQAAFILREVLDAWDVGGTARERIIEAWELLTGMSFVEVQLVEAAIDPSFGKPTAHSRQGESPQCPKCGGYRTGRTLMQVHARVRYTCYDSSCGHIWMVS